MAKYLRIRLALVVALFLSVMGAYVGPVAAAPWVHQISTGVAFQTEPTPTPVVVGAPPPITNPVTGDGATLDINQLLAMELVILGFVCTFVTSFLNKTISPTDPNASLKRGAVAFAVCFIFALGDTVLRGTLNLTNFVASLIIVFATAVTFYNQYFSKTQLAAKIEGRPAT